MTSHSEDSSRDLADESGAGHGSAESTTIHHPTLAGRLHYWWSLFLAGALLAIFGPPAIFIAWITRKPDLLYPWGLFGARNWLRLSGIKVRPRGLQFLDPKQTYVFVSNHKSYLDTATLFAHTGRRMGLIAKKELLKVPILGSGMGYANVMAIDRSNRERALQTMEAATARLRAGVSFGVFAEGTRARPGEFLPFKKGAFYMAVQAGVPVVPVAIKNTDRLMGKGTGESRPGTIELVVLPPVPTAGLSTDDDVKRLVEQVHSSIAKELGVPG